MIYATIAVAIVFFLIGKYVGSKKIGNLNIYQDCFWWRNRTAIIQVNKDYRWSKDESYIKAIRNVMGKPNATISEIVNWTEEHDNIMYLFEPFRCRNYDEKVMREVAKHYPADILL